METAAMVSKNKRLIGILVGVALILLIPLMLDAPWTLGDFVVAAVLLLGTGLMFELAARIGGNGAYKAGAGIALVAALLLIWTNLAVGLIGNENNPANLLYFGVVVIMFIGTAIARFKARGMAIALFVTALAQTLVPVIAFFTWRPEVTAGVAGVFVVSFFFALLFAGAAILFRYASTANPATRLQKTEISQ